MKKKLLTFTLAVLSAVALSAQECCKQTATSASDNVIRVARQTNDYFMQKYDDPGKDTFVKKRRTSNLWTRAVYYEGLLAFYVVDPQDRYLEYTRVWAQHHKWMPRDGVKTTNADNQCCGQPYIDYQLIIGCGQADMDTLRYVRECLDLQMQSGRTDYWTWIDAIQMAMPLYVKMYRLTGERKYLDYAMKSYRWTRNTCGGGCFNREEGLWWRDADYVAPYKEQDGQNCYWSRGNGWVLAALVRSMDMLPKTCAEYKELKKDYVTMCRALVKCQRADGYWNVSLHSPANYGGPEMTGTALFLYGMCWGVNHGLLKDKDYRDAIHRAWKALEGCVHPDGFLGYNQGTGKDPSAGQPVTYTSVPDFEDYGTGCFLLGAAEYYSYLER